MLEDLQFPGKNRVYSCRIRTFYNTLEESDQKLLMDYMADSSISHSGLAKALSAKTGQNLADTAMRKHRLGLCSCSRI
jgi:hypothetical protein